MPPGLSDRDREQFQRLRERLKGVGRIEREPTVLDGSPGPIDPMLCTVFEGDLAAVHESEWIAERKFDGTRIVLEKFDGQVQLWTRRHVERSGTLAELTAIAETELPDGLIVDGEYTYLTADGLSRFVPIHAAADKVEAEGLSEHFFAFDVLAADGEWCTRDPLMDRKERLREVVPDAGLLSVVEYETADIEAFYDELVGRGEEGIIIKRRGSVYHLGTRSDHWRKVKAFMEADVIAVGYTPGEGRRSDTFGALVMTDGEHYVGRVGSGFDDAELGSLLQAMTPVEERPFPEEQVGMPYTPVEPFVIRVKYQEVTDAGELRAPVYLRNRPDKPTDDVTPIEGSAGG